MIIRIDPAAPTPPAEQLVAQVAAAIGDGELTEGERLPTIRQLAADLGLAAGTVARAYTELERDGWVASQGRRGTRVIPRPTGRSDETLASAADQLARAALVADLDVTAARRALDLAFARLRRTEPGSA